MAATVFAQVDWTDPVLNAYRETALGPIPDLSPADLADLVRAAQAGDLAARDTIAERYQRLVFSVALHYASHSQAAVMDLVQECNLGLLHALRKYQFGHGTTFATYAVRWMHHYCLDWLGNDRLIALPPLKQELLRRYERVVAELLAAGEPPSDAAICAAARITPEQLRELRHLPTTSSLEAIFTHNDRSESLAAALDAAATADEDETLSIALREALRQLDPTLRQIAIAHANGQSYETIGKMIGKGRERTRQLDQQARAQLRAILRGQHSAA